MIKNRRIKNAELTDGQAILKGAKGGSEMDTISKRLKDTLRTAMQDGETYSNASIRQLVYGKTGMKYGEDYKETHFAGCLSALKKSGEIIQVQRGEYIKGKPQVQSRERVTAELKNQNLLIKETDKSMLLAQVKDEIMQSVQKEVAYLKSVTQNIVFSFDTPAEDIQYMLRLKELVYKLEEFEQKADS